MALSAEESFRRGTMAMAARRVALRVSRFFETRAFFGNLSNREIKFPPHATILWRRLPDARRTLNGILLF